MCPSLNRILQYNYNIIKLIKRFIFILYLYNFNTIFRNNFRNYFNYNN